jgi:hypothetical protein
MRERELLVGRRQRCWPVMNVTFVYSGVHQSHIHRRRDCGAGRGSRTSEAASLPWAVRLGRPTVLTLITFNCGTAPVERPRHDSVDISIAVLWFMADAAEAP